MNGHIKLFRKFLKWEWYNDNYTKIVFLHCLLKANWKESKFEGIVIPRGSFVTSYQRMSEELSNNKQKITIQSIRTALKHLISTHELTIKTTNKYTIITVNNYDIYQEPNTLSNNQLTNNQQTTNNQLTTIEEYEEYKNNSVCNNSASSREENICHFNLNYKVENCSNCMKKNICKKETSQEFKFMHGGKSFEEWDKAREEELRKANQSLKQGNIKNIESYDWLEEGEKYESNNSKN